MHSGSSDWWSHLNSRVRFNSFNGCAVIVQMYTRASTCTHRRPVHLPGVAYCVGSFDNHWYCWWVSLSTADILDVDGGYPWQSLILLGTSLVNGNHWEAYLITTDVVGDILDNHWYCWGHPWQPLILLGMPLTTTDIAGDTLDNHWYCWSVSLSTTDILDVDGGHPWQPLILLWTSLVKGNP